VLAAGGRDDIRQRKLCKRLTRSGGQNLSRVHLTGSNLLPYLHSEVKESPRTALFLCQRSDGGCHWRSGNGDWKVVLFEDPACNANAGLGRNPMVKSCGFRIFLACDEIASSAPISTPTSVLGLGRAINVLPALRSTGSRGGPRSTQY